MSFERRLAGAGVTVLLAAGLAVATAAPAMAATTTTVSATSWTYVDAAVPHTTFPNPAGDAPVGAFAGGHITKSYITFDLSALRGNRLLAAELVAKETMVTDCTTTRETQAWLTAPKRKPTWADQPAELTALAGPGSLDACPSPRVGWDAKAALQRALDAGWQTATFALRLPDDQQQDPRFGRRYDPALTITLTYNRAPDAPTNPTMNYTPCGGQPLAMARTQVPLSAVITDPDGDRRSGEFAWWPVNHPDQRTTIETSKLPSDPVYPVTTYLDLSGLNDATAYAWAVRGKDDSDAGPWSTPCRFTTDFTAPAVAPTLSTPDYTATAPPGSGGTGVPGTFTFTANGVADVTGFYYGEYDALNYVPANHRGGSAAIRFTPADSGPDELTVVSVDGAGNRSPQTQYLFWVATNEPAVTCTPALAFPGEPRQCTFTPRGTGTVGYVYQFDGGPEISVPAGPDGTAVVTVTPTNADQSSRLRVQSRLDNGNLTATTSVYVNVKSSEPLIDEPAQPPLIGVPTTITFHAVLPGSVTFTYLLNETDQATVPVGPDGTATVELTFPTSGYQELDVFSTTANGIRSGTASTYLQVDSDQPTVTSTDYPENTYSGGVGESGQFVFSSSVPGVAGYTYSFNDGAPVTVPAGPDGTATVTLIPVQPYYQKLTVTSTFADGKVSEQRWYTFYANSVAPRMSCAGAPSPGQVYRCTFTPVQRDVVSYVYQLGGAPETRVTAAADGSATVDFVAPDSGTAFLTVWSVNGSGLRSDPLLTAIQVS